MKKLLLLLTLTFIISANAQDDKTVTLTVSGQGKTQDEAKQVALRSAIEQAFGAFISSKTEILNDNLVKDEIVSVTNGNIQKFDVLSEVQIPDGGYATTLKAVVSVTKLTSFCESKGVEVEFKGGLFAANIKIQELYEKNETEAVKNTINILKSISAKSFDYTIDAADPIFNNNNWNIPLTINVIANENFIKIPEQLQQTIKSISLSTAEYENYIKLNKPVFPLTLATINTKGIYQLRSETSIKLIIDFIYSLNNAIADFKISNGVENFSLSKYNTSIWNRGDESINITLHDENFRIILKDNFGICAASLFHNYCGSRHDSKKPNFDYKSVYQYNQKFGNSYKIEYGKIKDERYHFFSSESSKSFSQLQEIMLSNENLGLVISFSSVKTKSLLVQFKLNDVRNIEEIKTISKYEITK